MWTLLHPLGWYASSSSSSALMATCLCRSPLSLYPTDCSSRSAGAMLQLGLKVVLSERLRSLSPNPRKPGVYPMSPMLPLTCFFIQARTVGATLLAHTCAVAVRVVLHIDSEFRTPLHQPADARGELVLSKPGTDRESRPTRHAVDLVDLQVSSLLTIASVAGPMPLMLAVLRNMTGSPQHKSRRLSTAIFARVPKPSGIS